MKSYTRSRYSLSLDFVRALPKSQIVHFVGSRRDPTVSTTLLHDEFYERAKFNVESGERLQR
jgi:hypothetical protein